MKISVVLAVYNAVAEVGPTIDSILAQTERDFELIVVDDGSTDDTPRVLAEYVTPSVSEGPGGAGGASTPPDRTARPPRPLAPARGDSRIRIVTQPHAGLTSALIRGCVEASAPFIARHDAGDRSHPERFALQLACFDDPEVVLAATNARMFGPEGELMYGVQADGDAVRESLLHDDADRLRSIPHHGTAMFRRSAYLAANGYRASFRVAQDVDLWVRMARIGKIAVVPRELYDATFHPRSISAVARDAQVRATRIIVALRDRDGDPRARLAEAAAIRPGKAGRRGEAAGLYFIARCLRAQGNPAARRYLVRAIRRNPLHWRAWAALVSGR